MCVVPYVRTLWKKDCELLLLIYFMHSFTDFHRRWIFPQLIRWNFVTDAEQMGTLCRSRWNNVDELVSITNIFRKYWRFMNDFKAIETEVSEIETLKILFFKRTNFSSLKNQADDQLSETRTLVLFTYYITQKKKIFRPPHVTNFSKMRT